MSRKQGRNTSYLPLVQGHANKQHNNKQPYHRRSECMSEKLELNSNFPLQEQSLVIHFPAPVHRVLSSVVWDVRFHFHASELKKCAFVAATAKKMFNFLWQLIGRSPSLHQSVFAWVEQFVLAERLPRHEDYVENILGVYSSASWANYTYISSNCIKYLRICSVNFLWSS